MIDKNLDKLLTRLGRSSTPDVKENQAGLTYGSFLESAIQPQHPDSSLVIGSDTLWSRWPADAPAVHAMPGSLTGQAENLSFSRLVIDAEAFRSGPWLGSDTGGNQHLADEIFEAGRIFRATGRFVLWLPGQGAEGFSTARIRSTSSVDLSSIPEVDLEEDAPQSSMWNVLTEIVEERMGSGS